MEPGLGSARSGPSLPREQLLLLCAIIAKSFSRRHPGCRGSVSGYRVYHACGLLPSCPLSGSFYNRFSQAYLRLLIGEIGSNSTKKPFRLPLDIATKLEKWIRPPKFFPCLKLLHVL